MAEPSFIPKTFPQRLVRTQEPLGTLLFLGVLIFAISLLALAGLFSYRRLISGQISDLEKSLERLKADFDPGSIQELARVSESIETAKEVLGRHRRLSNVFLFLETNTLPDIRFSKFSFDANNSKLTLSAEAKSYAALYHQAEIFKKASPVNGVSLSSFSLASSGGVNYVVELSFNPSLVLTR